MQTHTNNKIPPTNRQTQTVWAEIILDQYNSVSEPKHKLGSCWKTLLHASSCLCVCVCFWGLPDGNEPHRPRPSLPPSGFPVLCCSNWKRLLISHKLWLFTVTFPSSSSFYLPLLRSLSKVCPLSLFFTFWTDDVMGFPVSRFSSFVIIKQGFPPHQNSWTMSFSRLTLNSPSPATWIRWNMKVCAMQSVCFCYLKTTRRTARLSGCWVLLCSKSSWTWD